MNTICNLIQAQVGNLFNCSEFQALIRIRTPYLYPDGDVIDLFAQEQQGHYILTDMGESLRWLKMQSNSQKKSLKQRELLEDICLNHGVELFKGMLIVRIKDTASFGTSLTRLSQAAIRVGDLWFTTRTRAIESIHDEVEDFFKIKNIRFDRAEKIPGRSGRIWRPDFHVRNPEKSALIYVLSTGSKAAARGLTEHVLASWYDLSYLQVGPESLKFVSLFDDTLDIWSQEDFQLLENLSEVALWSHPDELIDKLAA